jgi:hypothetical protein
MAYVPALDRHLVRFLTDRQDCLFWFLTLGDEGGPILVSGSDLTEEPPEEVDDISMVAPTFEEFIYRFWIENEIAFRTIDGDPLTDAQQAYLSEALRLAASTTEGLGRPPNPPPGSGDIRKHSLTRASCNLAPWPITRLT